MLIVLTKLYRQNGSLLTLKVLSVKQNSSGSTEECGQRGLSECYFCINSALRFAQWVQWLKQTTLHHLMTAEKIGGLLPLLGNFAVMVIDYLPFESVWKHAGIIYLNRGHPDLLKGKGNVLVLFRVFQTALNSVCAMILSMGLYDIAWEKL